MRAVGVDGSGGGLTLVRPVEHSWTRPVGWLAGWLADWLKSHVSNTRSAGLRTPAQRLLSTWV